MEDFAKVFRSDEFDSFIIMCAMLCYWGLDLQLYHIKNVGEIKIAIRYPEIPASEYNLPKIYISGTLIALIDGGFIYCQCFSQNF